MPAWKKVNAYVELTRPYNVTSVIFIYLIGFYFQPHGTNWSQLFYGMMLLVLFHCAASVQNDIEDIKIDQTNHLDRPIPTTISLVHAKRFLQILFVAALVVSLFNSATNIIFVPVLVVFIWLYNSHPFFFSRRPHLSILTLGLCSTLAPLLYGFILGGNRFTVIALLWILAWFLIRISITLLKDYKDERGDRLFYKRTFYLTYGKNVTAITSLVFASIGYFGLFIISFFLKQSVLLLAIPLCFAFISFLPRLLLIKISNNNDANSIFHSVLAKENRFELVYLLWIIFSR